MKERSPFDFYPTPLHHCRAGVSLISDRRIEYVLDPGAGTGPWGAAVRERYPNSIITGTDIRPLSKPRAYNFWFAGGYNYLGGVGENIFDLVVGNPPYGQFEGKKDALLAEKFCRISLRLLRPGGWLVFLLPVTFVAGQKRALGIYSTDKLYAFCPSAERPSFTGDGNTDATEYCYLLWKKGFQGEGKIIPAVFASHFQEPLKPDPAPKKLFLL